MQGGWNQLAVVVELCISIAVVLFVRHSEIDWTAYMQEVKGFIDGELDYKKLQGNTGPLVYPAGFVWSYSALYFISRGGRDVEIVRWLFLGMYVMLFHTVSQLYLRSGTNRLLICFLLLSKRVRSLFLLRFFNDCLAMFVLYYAVLCLSSGKRWLVGSLLFSISVSIKMNILLFSPGLLLVLCKSLPISKVIQCLVVCALWQLLVGLPFLLHNPASYIARSFEVGRVFTYRWSVNFKCFSEETFASPVLSVFLLLFTIVSWVILWRRRWAKRKFCRVEKPSVGAEEAPGLSYKEECDLNKEISSNIVLTLMESNMIGVIFCRSLHYQFFLWFFHSMPMVLFATRLTPMLKIISIAAIQCGFEIYPSTSKSSSFLLAGFACTWFSILFLGAEGRPRGMLRTEVRGKLT
ncbi:putative ALG3 protein [Trypanosoma vivax]|uniref:dolichyl-P-Man:Man5GlcNAc2-PP-dolichol alpha-1,3-mannosyltransferase n=1 Tax=Trypanosoma vivax (strain Y486) TaxID=1055687 RepID=G0U6U6_TRYVY|nr:putative alpha-1,3-mannosyltransferase [Trypanosoma vivax]KAH8611209.1 putative ALG3 protein [Trypanosoma vivax]CCC51601.1 putative alpha-1,3-mannosyltransferase [Trypanosoma vivax Y486]